MTSKFEVYNSIDAIQDAKINKATSLGKKHASLKKLMPNPSARKKLVSALSPTNERSSEKRISSQKKRDGSHSRTRHIQIADSSIAYDLQQNSNEKIFK